MNKHILLVIDHQLNPDKYTKAQLEDNYKTATYCGEASKWKSYEAYRAAYRAAYCANTGGSTSVDYYLNEYFEESGENKDDYIMELTK